ncbi:MAG TPA: hypothetical protein VKE51_22905 [Vicinamibacterales bacterium]|nr:hypothetical protein [Vicinamibacterales bacterium]
MRINKRPIVDRAIAASGCGVFRQILEARRGRLLTQRTARFSGRCSRSRPAWIALSEREEQITRSASIEPAILALRRDFCDRTAQRNGPCALEAHGDSSEEIREYVVIEQVVRLDESSLPKGGTRLDMHGIRLFIEGAVVAGRGPMALPS